MGLVVKELKLNMNKLFIYKEFFLFLVLFLFLLFLYF